MKKYRVIYAGDVESSDDYYEAQEEFQATRVGEILEDGTVGFELALTDVQVLPPEANVDYFKRHDEVQQQEKHDLVHGGPQERPSGLASTYPDDAPPHPWDQGLWIFPEDHPLAVYERFSKIGDARGWRRDPSTQEKEKQAFLEAGQKMLPPGE